MPSPETIAAAERSLAHDDIPVSPDEEKFAELLLLVAEELLDDPAGGATKLNKALYFAEFDHVRRTGRPISGVSYQRLPHGPAPRRLLPVRQMLIQRGDAELVRERVVDHEQERLEPRRPAQRDRFTESELESVRAGVRRTQGLTARGVSDVSHVERGWVAVHEGEDIPYAFALVLPAPPATSAHVRRSAADALRRYEASRATA